MYPATRVQITGHTDSVGDAAYNQDLSLRRASSVMLVARSLMGCLSAVGYFKGREKQMPFSRAARAW